jgi:DNA helicase-2/ATP-dependent DNA helicase PcrA
MTIHAAKGLEFPEVILAGLNDNVLPSTRVQTQADLEEERRVAYVAMTRAQINLVLSSSGGYDNKNHPVLPSRFLAEIDVQSLPRGCRKFYRYDQIPCFEFLASSPTPFPHESPTS